ncbi:shikimate dehydrogenase [Lysobacter xanthus]
MLRYAVFGHPVAHSRSPAIHAAFAAQCGIALDYARIDAAPDAFAQAVARFGHDGGRGANVTLPHKAAAAALCTSLSPRAARAGAVNTLVRLDDGDASTPRWHGDNTDGVGLVRDVRERHDLALDGARVWLIGAGGAAAGVAPALLDAGVARLVVVNRGAERLAQLVARLDDPRVQPRAWGDGVDDAPVFDLVINSTSAARDAADVEWPLPSSLAPRWAAVDLGYGASARPFLDAAGSRGAAVGIDGLGMLVEQAAESFRLWHGIAPHTDDVYAMLRRELDAG